MILSNGTGTAIIAVTTIQSGILMIDFTDNVEDSYAQVCIPSKERDRHKG